jgi:glutaredoxin
MTIDVYGKKGCGVCEAAKDKLRKLGLPFSEHDLAETVEFHEGWRDDGTIEIMAAYAANNQGMPIITIDGEAFTYSGAMKRLKRGDDAEAPS